MTLSAPAPHLRTAPRWVLLAITPALLLAALQAAWPWPFFSDDSFISLRYVERLLTGHGLTWTNGERVEGYSNLLWVLGCAGLGSLGLDLVFAARLLGAVCTTAALWCLARASAPHDLRSSLLAGIAPLLVAATQTVLVWTVAGLEGPLVLWLLAWGFSGLAREFAAQPNAAPWRSRTFWRCGVPFALLCLTRPDGPLWAATTGTVLGLSLLRQGWSLAGWRTLQFGAWPLLAVAGQLVGRLCYYGDWLPNTAHVKAEFDPGAVTAGWLYVRSALAAMPGLTVTSLLGLLWLLCRARTRPVAAMLGLGTLLWFAYLVSIGGDHFPGRRLLHGALAPMALLVGLAVRPCAHRTWRTGLAVLAALVAAAFDAYAARHDAQSLEAHGEVWEWRGKVLGEVLANAFPEAEPRLAVDAAGAVPYYSRLPALDMLGLCDRTVATTPLPGWLQSMPASIPRPPGHLRGNGHYVMDCAPDLLLFSNPPGLPLPVFVSALEFEDDPRFLNGYRCVLLDTGPRQILPDRTESLVCPLWVRLDGRVGVQRSETRLEIPAWLFGAYTLPEPLQRRHQPSTGDAAAEAQRAKHLAAAARWFGERAVVATPTATGALQVELRGTSSAAFRLAVPAGTWQWTVQPAAIATLTAEGQVVGPVADSFVVPADAGEIELVLRAAPDATMPLRVERIVLQRRRP